MNITYSGVVETLITAIKKAEELLSNPQFYERIAKHPDFDYTEEKPSQISTWINQSTLIIVVKEYKPKDPNTITTAYVTSKYPNTLFINSYRLDRGIAKIANTIIHEAVHAVDKSLPKNHFGHGDNNWRGKENSAPYWIGKLAERILNGEDHKDDSSIIFDEVEVIEKLEQLEEMGEII